MVFLSFFAATTGTPLAQPLAPPPVMLDEQPANSLIDVLQSIVDGRQGKSAFAQVPDLIVELSQRSDTDPDRLALIERKYAIGLLLEDDPNSRLNAWDRAVALLFADRPEDLLEKLREIWNSDKPGAQAAGGRGSIRLAREALKAGNTARAADLAITPYLSSVPNLDRYEAFRIFAMADQERAAPYAKLILDGEMDPWLANELPFLFCDASTPEALKVKEALETGDR